MNILIVNKYFFVTGGPERYMFSIMELLEKKGHKVIPLSLNITKNIETKYKDYFISSPFGENDSHFLDSNLSLSDKIKLVMRSLYSFEAKKKAAEIIVKENIDVIYILNICNYISPSIIDAAKEHGVKIVMRLSDFNFICASYLFYRNGKACEKCQQNILYSLKYKCMRGSLPLTFARAVTIATHRIMKLYQKVDCFIAPSRKMRDALIEFGIEENKVNYVPSFVNIEKYTSHSDHDGYVLFFGRISHEKGVQELVKAWAIFGKNAPPLLVIGDGEYVNEVKQLKNNLGVVNINFLSFMHDQDQLISYIQRCAFTVIPSLCYDNSPMAAYESMACGKAVIASNIGGLKDQIEDGVNGYLVPPEKPEALAAAVNKLWNSPSDICAFGKSSRDKMETLFSAESHLNKLLKHFSNND